MYTGVAVGASLASWGGPNDSLAPPFSVMGGGWPLGPPLPGYAPVYANYWRGYNFGKAEARRRREMFCIDFPSISYIILFPPSFGPKGGGEHASLQIIPGGRGWQLSPLPKYFCRRKILPPLYLQFSSGFRLL